MDHLEELIEGIENKKIKQEVLYMIRSIKLDIEENYAEIIRPNHN